jgi:hypothetical protein
MWSLQAPAITAEVAFESSISRVRDADLKRRLQQIVPDIIAASRAYDAAAKVTELHLVPVVASIRNLVSSREMSAVYDYRMAKSGSPGRTIYDAILSAPKHGRCPLCGHRIVSTLDHHLPKSSYPALAVAPLNLVPACADCNKSKLDVRPATSSVETIHPYFDELGAEVWLQAAVLEGDFVALHFFVDIPVTWSGVLGDRVQNHFNMLGLGALYASQAGQELASIYGYLRNLAISAGEEAVRLYLTDHVASCERVGANSWQAAMYRALANSIWFCNVGVMLEP